MKQFERIAKSIGIMEDNKVRVRICLLPSSAFYNCTWVLAHVWCWHCLYSFVARCLSSLYTQGRAAGKEVVSDWQLAS